MNLLTHGRADARHDELIDIIQGQAERRNRFLGNLLDMTRLDAGVVRAEPCNFSRRSSRNRPPSYEVETCSLLALNILEIPPTLNLDIPRR